jgi:hypothetical protein
MNVSPLFASGDPVLFLMLGGVLLLAGATIGLGVAGVIMLFGKSDEKKKTGKRLIVSASIPVIVATVWWIIVVGFD